MKVATKKSQGRHRSPGQKVRYRGRTRQKALVDEEIKIIFGTLTDREFGLTELKSIGSTRLLGRRLGRHRIPKEVT